jgi:hypothetical protein
MAKSRVNPQAVNSDKVFCPGCESSYHRRGFATHQISCLRKAQQREKDKIFEEKLKRKASEKLAGEYHLSLIFVCYQ